MSENKENNKKNFISLLDKYKNNVVVPIIQRGYAQGRKTHKVKKIREDFLDAIIDFLSNYKEELILDYIYGVEDNDVFYLLDGQQRLTTLFLFYWYFKSSLNIDDEILKRFTYETRNSSKDFISFLLSIEEIDLKTDEKLSKELKNNIKFLNFWEKDTTVKGMLQVIDDIHEKVKNKENIDSNKLNSIQFYCEYIKGDPDDLYIKMNSRGKQLTDFEIFKSKLEKFLDEDEEDKNVQGFDKKIDIDWTNFLWDFIKDKKSDNENNNEDEGYRLDNLFMKLFSFIFEMLYYSQIEIVEDTRKLQIEKSNLEFFELFFSHIGDKEKKEYINKLKAIENNEEDKKIALKNNIEFIINIFDILSELRKDEDKLKKLFNDIFYHNNESKNDEDKYNKICTFDNNLNVFNNDDNLFEFFKNIEKRILIFFVFKILNYEYSKKIKNIDIDNIRNKYFNKLRLVRNLLYNTDNLYNNIYYQMKLIDKIITQDEFEVIKIQLSNKKDSIKNTLFTKDLIKSEKEKLKKLNENNENINKNIYACENNIFLQGNIDFLLDNISDKNIVDVVNYIFIKDSFNNENENYLIHRAMLSFIDIENIIKGCKEYEYKYNIYTEYIFKNYQLWDNRQDDKERFINFIKAISKKINDKNTKEDIEKSINEICQNIIDNPEKYVKDENDFRYLLIKDAAYGDENKTNLFHYISGTIKSKGNRGYYLYLNKTKQSIWDIPLSTKVHTMFAKFLKKHTDFKLYYYDGNNNNNIITDDDKSRILMYPNNNFLYCYEWVTLAKEIEIANEKVLVGFTTDGYCLECGLIKKIPYDDEKRTRKVLSKIEERKINLKKYYKCDNNFYWYYFDTCDNISLLEKEYKILKSVIDAFPTK
ncbi:DUF262 domain-containing protein [Brachyspira pilosicoli]|uniref:DUF262 domain-containing protein n=1 Tax=Brachyspira pilosicoli TaxID=52584 RepID=UPI00258711F4|nr:DUF262 domain-containing protein [Brachyspira pilosicoli]